MSDAKRAKLDLEAAAEAGDTATAADAADPGANEAEDNYEYEDDELAINEEDIAAQAEAEQAIAALEVLQRQLLEVWGRDLCWAVLDALLHDCSLYPVVLPTHGR